VTKHAFRFAIVLMLAGLVGHASAEDDRPSEVPYQTQDPVLGTPALSPDYKMTSHKVVLITDQALSPRLVDLQKGQLVAWISYSAAPSTIVFEREVARSMVCHSLVNFSIQDDELRSAPIHSGEFASFCQLQPGRYRYKVVRNTGIPRQDARNRLEGVIVVHDDKPDEG
jgi:hypothetical protein